jgi:hypothetical protein
LLLPALLLPALLLPAVLCAVTAMLGAALAAHAALVSGTFVALRH